jgi:hypothetical protein
MVDLHGRIHSNLIVCTTQEYLVGKVPRTAANGNAAAFSAELNRAISLRTRQDAGIRTYT